MSGNLTAVVEVGSGAATTVGSHNFTSPLPDYTDTTGDYTRLLLIVYCLLMLFMGIGANIFVTYSSTNYRSIRFDRWGPILTRNLSIADGLYTLFVIFPVLINNLGRKWVFGEVSCHMSAGFRITLMLASTNFLTGVSVHRLLQGLNPLRDYITLTRNSVGLSVIVWIYSSLVSVRLFTYDTFQVRFDSEIAYCKFQGYRHSCENFIFTTVMLTIPFCIIITSHLLLYYISKKQLNRSKKIRKQSIKAPGLVNAGKLRERRGIRRTLSTLTSLAALLVISWLPNILFHLLPLHGYHWRHFRRAVMYLYFLNTVGNPILYTLVNRDFKNYAKRQIVSFISKDFNTEMNRRNRTYTARLSPLSAGSSSYVRPVKSAVL